MAAPYHHALSSVKKWGGEPGDYIAIHEWFDGSKEMFNDFRHRALRHHAEGIYRMAEIFGDPIDHTIRLSTGKKIPVRWVGEQHVTEDLGFIPSVADWLVNIQPQPWMQRAAGPIARSLETLSS